MVGGGGCEKESLFWALNVVDGGSETPRAERLSDPRGEGKEGVLSCKGTNGDPERGENHLRRVGEP